MDYSLQAPLSMGFSRQEHWSGLPFPSPGDLLDPGIESGSLALQEDSLPTEVGEKPLYYTIVPPHPMPQGHPSAPALST